MEKYKDMTIKKKGNVKMLRNLILFFGLIVFTFWFIFKDQDLNELVTAIKRVDIKYFIIAVLLMFCVYLAESFNIKCILKAFGEKKCSIFRALKYTAIGSFFSAITPAATGGQPVEVYYMSKDGVRPPHGAMTMLLQLSGFQISTLVYSIVCGILNPSILSDGVIWFYILGLAINMIALLFMLIGTFSEKVANKLLNFTIKMLKKFKVRNADIKCKKIKEGLDQYNVCSKFIKDNPMEFVKAVLRVFVQIGIYHSIPFFIYRAFGLTELNFFQLFSMQAILYTTVSGIPLPGSIGVSETLFMKIFGFAFGTSILSGAMLLYRFASFYLYIIIFAVVVLIVSLRTKDIESEIDKEVKEIDEVPITKKRKAYA